MRIGALSGLVTAALAVLASGAFLVLHPATPLPPEWNPAEPLDVRLRVTPLTRWKLSRAASGAACFAALGTYCAQFAALPDFEGSPVCHIQDRVRLTSLGTARIAPLETRCATALALAIWVRHGMRPAAEATLGSPVAEVRHLDSYNCRPIRTPEGEGVRMSLHATAEAVDITGVVLEDGRSISLIDDWGTGAEGAFLRSARDASCDWFATTLGPEYNALHADHFHLQTRGFGLCR